MMEEKHYEKPSFRVIYLKYESNLLTGSDPSEGLGLGIDDWGDGGDIGGDAH